MLSIQMNRSRWLEFVFPVCRSSKPRIRPPLVVLVLIQTWMVKVSGAVSWPRV